MERPAARQLGSSRDWHDHKKFVATHGFHSALLQPFLSLKACLSFCVFRKNVSFVPHLDGVDAGHLRLFDGLSSKFPS